MSELTLPVIFPSENSVRNLCGHKTNTHISSSTITLLQFKHPTIRSGFVAPGPIVPAFTAWSQTNKLLWHLAFIGVVDEIWSQLITGRLLTAGVDLQLSTCDWDQSGWTLSPGGTRQVKESLDWCWCSSNSLSSPGLLWAALSGVPWKTWAFPTSCQCLCEMWGWTPSPDPFRQGRYHRCPHKATGTRFNNRREEKDLKQVIWNNQQQQ